MKEGFMTANVFDVLAIVNNGDALFRWLKENENDLPVVILSDLNMPGKNGYDIIAGIKATPAYRHIPAIITVTSSTKSFIDKGMAFGAAAYLVKPGTFVEYVPFVHKVHSTIEENALVS